MAFGGRIFSKDVLKVEKRPAVRVFCVSCKEHIYYLRKEDGGARLDNLVPVDSPAPQDLTCPRCGQVFVAFSPGSTLFTDRGYITNEV